jgi:hypothetical protein
MVDVLGLIVALAKSKALSDSTVADSVWLSPVSRWISFGNHCYPVLHWLIEGHNSHTMRLGYQCHSFGSRHH